MKLILKKAAVLLLVLAFIIAGIFVYLDYAAQKIFEDSSSHLQTTYQQVSNNFTSFCTINWSFLDNFEDNLLEDGKNPTSKKVESEFSQFKDLQSEYGYSELYLFNEDSDYATVAGRHGAAQSIEGAFNEMFKSGEPMITSYISSSNVRKAVFARPLQTPIKIGGKKYTAIAVCYENEYIENRVVGEVCNDNSDCYLVKPDGQVVLSLQPKTVLTDFIADFLDYAQSDADSFEYGSFDGLKENLSAGKRGSLLCAYDGESLYVVNQPVGINGWSIVAVVKADVADASLKELQIVTSIIAAFVAVVLFVFLLTISYLRSRQRLNAERLQRTTAEHESKLMSQLFDGITCVVDRFATVSLKTGTYEYHERVKSKVDYPRKGRYEDLLRLISDTYAILSNTENVKFAQVLSLENVRKALQKPGDIMRIEYGYRTGSEYKLMSVVPVAWDAEGDLAEFMMIAQDIGKKVELEKAANTDGLTGLFNERCFSTVLHRKEELGEPFTLCYLDLDRFKPVNDIYGHDMGDKLLRQVAQRILECIRDKDYAFRIGGDEFCLVISAAFSEEESSSFVGRLRDALSKPYVIDGVELDVGASCAYARYPEEGSDPGAVRKLADARMYEDKRRRAASR
ncbi:MAG: sensor domain-containing diguanylate cyclase [Coriobacteriia bacterium]|nr:sensor domain-containing diguanylate cyclase [Coriobacteriia bacterium]